MIKIFGYQIEPWLFWAIIGLGATVFFGLITLFAWILPRKAKLHPKERETIDHLKEKIETIEKEY
jgi:hypothetical protein